MSDGENQTVVGKQEHENLSIRMKIIDMMEYSLPLIERWSVPHQKLLGDKMSEVMEEMLLIASELQWAYSKKTPLKKLDYLNKGLQDLITVAFRCKYMKGVSSYHEWTRRSKEIGLMIGGYGKWVYEEAPQEEPKDNKKVMRGRRRM